MKIHGNASYTRFPEDPPPTPPESPPAPPPTLTDGIDSVVAGDLRPVAPAASELPRLTPGLVAALKDVRPQLSLTPEMIEALKAAHIDPSRPDLRAQLGNLAHEALVELMQRLFSGAVPTTNRINNITGGTFDEGANAVMLALILEEFIEDAMAAGSGTPNRLTGDELLKAALESVADQGGEYAELRHLSIHAHNSWDRLDDAAKRATAVIDRYLNMVEAQGGRDLTPTEKAQFERELRAAIAQQ